MHIGEKELKVAWDFFDQKGTGKISAHEIKKRLAVFYKNVSVKEIRYLLNNQSEITFDELYIFQALFCSASTALFYFETSI